MKKHLFSIVLAFGIVFAGISQEEKEKWSVQIGLADTWLIQQDVVSGYATDDYFEEDSGTDWDFKIKYDIDDLITVGIGHNEVEFSGKSNADGFMTDMEISATYVTLEFRHGNKWEGYGVIELGASELGDIDLTVPSFGINGVNIYKGDSGTYWSIGGGCKWHFSETMFLDLSFRHREYGTLKRNANNTTSALEDIDISTDGFNLAIGWKF